MNVAAYTGNLVADVECIEKGDDIKYANFRIAVKRPMKKDQTDFFMCVCFNQTAELVAKYFKRGDYIAVTGYSTINKYTREDGVVKSYYQLVVTNVSFCGSKKSSKQDPNDDSDRYAQNAPPANYEEYVEVDDDDLPF